MTKINCLLGLRYIFGKCYCKISKATAFASLLFVITCFLSCVIVVVPLKSPGIFRDSVPWLISEKVLTVCSRVCYVATPPQIQ